MVVQGFSEHGFRAWQIVRELRVEVIWWKDTSALFLQGSG